MSSRVELLFHFCVNTLRESDQKLRYKRRGITSPFLMTSLVIKNLFLQVGQNSCLSKIEQKPTVRNACPTKL